MKFRKTLLAANTHFVGIVGVSVGFLGGVVDYLNANPQISAAVLGILPADLRPLVGTGLGFLGLALAYFGRPKSVPPSDKTQVAVAEATGQPRPITPAGP